MKRNPRTVRNSGGTAEHGGEGPKRWSSERAIRRHVSGGGRALPSKWDDAERWITSPVSSHGSAAATPRRPLTTAAGLLRGTSSPDDILDGAKEEAPVSDGATTKKLIDKGRCPSSFSLHQNGVPASVDEVRDVEVDKGMTTAGHGQSEKQGVREMKDSSHVQDIPLPRNASQDSKDTSKFQRGEAKITAWENLQKAKAEAAIRKLEMKLENKRAASMDRIMKKLRASEMKAEAMRNLLSENDPTRVGTTTSSHGHGGISVAKYVKLPLHSNCFLCHTN